MGQFEEGLKEGQEAVRLEPKVEPPYVDRKTSDHDYSVLSRYPVEGLKSPNRKGNCYEDQDAFLPYQGDTAEVWPPQCEKCSETSLFCSNRSGT